jgi:ATP-dependent Lhr-like helicase
MPPPADEPLALFRPAVRDWFTGAFPAPTRPQALGWPVIARGESLLLLSPTGSGKTLAAFLWCIDRLMFEPVPPPRSRCRVLYVSPLKALAVDVERNLRAPIAGIANLAVAAGTPHVVPAVAVRTGDTPAAERSRFRREPADILVTTPESLYLLLTSGARETLRPVDTVIVDEIHALVPTKRGAHLALSLERLAALTGRRLQRIGLSATQRPLDEVALYLGGAEAAAPPRAPGRRGRSPSGRVPAARGVARRVTAGELAEPAAALHDEFADRVTADAPRVPRPVTIVDARAPKELDLLLEVPVEDMAALSQPVDLASGPASQGPVRPSIWTAIHPRLLDLVRAHRSTLIFVNSRRAAERLAGALNDLAGEPLVGAHHGSLARAQRAEIEDSLKAGTLRGLVATSSLELGIDMGAIDLVVQIESPPSVASGLQRIGRAGHQVGAVSRGIIVPKYRGDLVACAAVTRAMREGRVEATRYPRNPLDVLAQQIVAMAGMEAWRVDELFDCVRGAAPFADLGRGVFDGVLDMLAGRHPSDEFAELRPRITWDRVGGTIAAREGARRVAVVNGGTIPDRGLYGVFLAGGPRGTARVGELDEEMVFESRVGETFVLGASTWRIEEITHDRVLVSPAPGEPGKMPFWKGESATRPLEFGRAIGALVRTLDALPVPAAVERLTRDHHLDPRAAEQLVAYLREQRAATGAVPDDRTIVIERCRDELGDWRVCLLSPFGGQVLAPWSLAAVARVRAQLGLDVETMWTDEGFVVRFPESDDPPDAALLLPAPEEAEELVIAQLAGSQLFAARFRESAARALLLPRRRPGQRMPLWQQRKRAADLLSVAASFGSFPMLLEAYRECLRDVFDMPAFLATLREVRGGALRVVTVDSAAPSPFAASLLFGYVANYIYDGDAPLAERRAQALAIDQAQLRELLGDAELRELLDAEVMAAVERERQHLDPARRARSADALHDLLLRVGDLTAGEVALRSDGDHRAWIAALLAERRAVQLHIAGEPRLAAVEDAARVRDALGVPLPPGLPEALLGAVRDPKADLALRFARTHAPFTAAELGRRFGLPGASFEGVLRRLTATGRLVEGAFRPGGTHREWCETGVLAAIRQRSLARVRHEVEPVEARVLGRFLTVWHGTTRPRPGLDSLLDVVERLQGAPLAASLLEREILPARVDGFTPADLDTLLAAGEVVWVGTEPLGDRDGRLALYLADHLPRLWRPPAAAAPTSPREAALLDALARGGALYFGELHEAAGGGFPAETVSALWALAWRGLVTNDGLQALRAFLAPPSRTRRAATGVAPFRSRRTAPAAGGGRWSLTAARVTRPASDTEWGTAVAQQLLARNGVVTREVATAEGLVGGFSGIYDVFRRMEERGRLRRGYFAAGVGAVQFATPAALELLRSLRAEPDEPEVVTLAATDPANPYGALLRWPEPDTPIGAGRGPTRSVGARVVLVNGALGAYVARSRRQILSFLPAEEPDRSVAGRAVATALAALAREGDAREAGLLVQEINGGPASDHPACAHLATAGFVASAMGFVVPRARDDGRAPGAGTAGLRRPGVRPPPLRSSPWSVLRQRSGDEK